MIGAYTGAVSFGYGNYIVAIGYKAQCYACSNHCSVAIGAFAMAGNNYAKYAGVAIGYESNCAGGGAKWGVVLGAKAAKNATSGCSNVFIGYGAGEHQSGGSDKTNYGQRNIYIGANTKSGTAATFFVDDEIVIGYGATGCGTGTTVIGNSSTSSSCVCGCFRKTSGSFRIVHPEPAKKNKWLFHSFVESPTEGDNVYRWTVDISNCRCSLPLPSYYKYLNKNDMSWVKPVGHFGDAFAEVDEKQENLIICSNKDGQYNVLLIGTRKDEAVKEWEGVETYCKQN